MLRCILRYFLILFLIVIFRGVSFTAIKRSWIGNIRVDVRDGYAVIKWNILDHLTFIRRDNIEEYYTKGISTSCLRGGWYIKYRVEYGTASRVYNWVVVGEEEKRYEDGEVEVILDNLKRDSIYYFRVICEGYLRKIEMRLEQTSEGEWVRRIIKKRPEGRYHWRDVSKERMFSMLGVPKQDVECEVVFIETEMRPEYKGGSRPCATIVENVESFDVRESTCGRYEFWHTYRGGRYILMLEEGNVIRGNIDERGRFKLKGIRPGDYFMTVDGGKIGDSDFGYMTNFILRVEPNKKYIRIKMMVFREVLPYVELDSYEKFYELVEEFKLRYLDVESWGGRCIVLPFNLIETYKILSSHPKIKRVCTSERLGAFYCYNFDELDE